MLRLPDSKVGHVVVANTTRKDMNSLSAWACGLPVRARRQAHHSG